MRISSPNRPVMCVLLVGLWIFLVCLPADASEVSIISTEQLMGMLDNPAVVIIDVRAGQDWQSSDMKIKGAVRRLPKKFKSWANDFAKEKTLVLY